MSRASEVEQLRLRIENNGTFSIELIRLNMGLGHNWRLSGVGCNSYESLIDKVKDSFEYKDLLTKNVKPLYSRVTLTEKLEELNQIRPGIAEQ